MNIKKTACSIFAAVMAFASMGSVSLTSSAYLAPSENPEPGLNSTNVSWLVQLYNIGQPEYGRPATNYEIDYSQVAKFSVTFTVMEEDRVFWDGNVGGGLVLSINGGDIPMYVTDENGDPVYETDENGDIVYRTDHETGEFVLDENGNKNPQKKQHPLYGKYNWQLQTWWGVTDEELGIATTASDNDIVAEKIGDYTYKLTSNAFENPLANGDAKKIDLMQIAFQDFASSAIAAVQVTSVEVMDSSDNVLISFDGDGKASTDNTAEPSAEGALAVVENPELPLTVTTPTMWYALGYSEGKMINGETNEPYPSLEFDIDYSKVAKLSATLRVVEEDRDIFDGQCAGGLALSIAGGDIQVGNKELWDKYIWQLNQWWGVKDEALGLDKQAVEQDMLAEKVGDYTYKITSKVFDNPLANGDTQAIEHMMFGIQEWGYNKAKMRVLQFDVMDISGNVLLSYDENGKATIPTVSEPDTSEPDSGNNTGSTPPSSGTSDTSSSVSDNTSSTPDKIVEFVPAPVVDETVDEETAKVIAEIKVSAPEAAFEAGTTLTVKKVDSVGGENTFALDITFMLNGTAVQPKDDMTVTVSVPIPPKFKDVNEDLLKVFHYLNGKYTKVEATVKNGTVTFDTTHFSTYVISPDDLTANNPPENSSVAPETPNPSTGVAAVSVLPIAAIVGAVVIISKKKK